MTPVPPVLRPKGTSTNKVLIAVGCLVVLAVLGGLGFAYLAANSDSDTERTLDMLRGEWKNVESANGLFTLDFPTGAESSARRIKVTNGQVADTGLLLGGIRDVNKAESGIVFEDVDAANVGETAESIAARTDALLDDAANGALRGMGATLDNSNPASSPLGPSLSFTGSQEGGALFVTGFIVVAGTRVGIVFVIVPDSEQRLAAGSLFKVVSSLERGA